MAGEEGLEPSNAGIKIRCLNQLGDSPANLLKTVSYSFFEPPSEMSLADANCNTSVLARGLARTLLAAFAQG